MKLLLAAAVLAAIAIGIGAAPAFGFLFVWGWIFPFQESWDDTWHEFLPVGIAYLIWFAAAAATFVVGLRFVRRRLG